MDVDAGNDAGVLDTRVAVDDGGGSDAEATDWARGPDLPHPIQEIAGVVHDGAIVIAGGLDGLTVLDEVWRFDGVTWTALPDLPAPRHHVMLVSTPGALFAIGGMQSLAFDPLDTVLRLPDGASAWETVAPMPEPRAAAVGAFVHGVILICGGQSDRGVEADVLRFDLAATWTRGAAMADAREHVAGFVRDDEVWVVAGRDLDPATAVTSVSVYDPVANTWREGPSLAELRGGHGTAILPDGSAIVTGGEIGGAVRATTEILAVDGSTWSFGPSLATRRHGHVSLPLDGRLWVIGGADAPLVASVDVVESIALPIP